MTVFALTPPPPCMVGVRPVAPHGTVVGGKSVGHAIEGVICVAVAVVQLVAVWLVPRAAGDLYVAFAGARDVLDGKLGGVDDWSFANAGHTWINQNWGAHLLYFGAYRLGGTTGILVLKGAILVLLVAAVGLLVRAHRVSAPMAVLVAASVVVAGHAYIDLRPNLVSLTFSPLLAWLLLRTRSAPHALWAPVALLWLWGNMHGGFVFGLAMLAIWCGLRLIHDMTAGHRSLRSSWPFVAAPLLATALIGLANPFGIENLTHPFVVGRSEAWRQVAEWMPLFTVADVDALYGSGVEFLVAAGVLAMLASGRLLVRLLAHRDGVVPADLALLAFAAGFSLLVVVQALPVSRAIDAEMARLGATPAGQAATIETLGRVRARTVLALYAFAVIAVGSTAALLGAAVARSRCANRGRGARRAAFGLDASTLLFDLIVAGMVSYMALASRRFVPLAIIMSAPLLALHVGWLAELLARYRPIPVAVIGLALVLPAGRLIAGERLQYAAANPFHARQMSSIFERMFYEDTYPHGAAEFINRNGIEGRVYEDWHWEGFLHWRCPQLKLYVGGRAQQAYDEAAFLRRTAIWNGRDPETGEPVDRLRELDRLEIRYVVLPLRAEAAEFLRALLAPASPWTVLYFDRETNSVLCDASDPRAASLVERLMADRLWYPDADIAAVSRGLGMSFRSELPADRRRDALVAANARMPKVATYHRLVDMAVGGELPVPWLLGYLRSEFDRLAAAVPDAYEGLDVLRTRQRVGQLILELSKRDSTLGEQDAARIASELGRTRGAILTAQDEWQEQASTPR
jgi:hypothetical protein